MRKIGLSAGLLTLILFAMPQASALTITASTNWSQISPVPVSTDTITVNTGARVTIDVGNAQVGTLNLGTNGSGNGAIGFVSGSRLNIATSLVVGNGSAVGMVDMSLGGTLQVTSISDVNASFVPGNGSVVFNNGSTITLPATFTTYNTLTIAAATAKVAQTTNVATLNLGDPSGSSGTLDVNGQTFTANSIGILGGNADAVTDSGGAAKLTLNIPAGTVSYGGILSGNNLTLEKQGLGTLILTGMNTTYGTTASPGTQVSNGTLQLGAQNCISSGTLVIGNNSNSSGILDLHGFNQTVQNVSTQGTGNGNMLENTTGQSTLSLPNASGTYSGGISGSGLTLNVSTGSTFTLSGNNTFGGNINLLSGTLRIGASNSLSQSTLLTLGNSVGNTSTTFDLNGFNQTVAGVGASGSGTQTVTNTAGGQVTFTVGSTQSPGMNSVFTGQIMNNLNVAVDAGTTLTFGGTPGFSGSFQVLNGTLKYAQSYANSPPVVLGSGSSAGTLDLNGFDVGIQSLATSGTSSANTVRDSTAMNPQSAHTLTLLQGGSTTFAGQCTANLVLANNGTLTLGQTNSIANLTVSGGGTVSASVQNVFMAGAALTVGGASSAGTFNLNGHDQSVGTITTTGSLQGSDIITSVSAALLTIQNNTPSNPFAFNGVVSGAVSLNISTNNSSPFTFTGGAYSGTTTLANGPMIVTGSVGGPFTVTGSNGGPLSGTGTAGQLTLTNNAIVSPGAGTVGTLNATSANLSAGILKIRIPANNSADQLNDFGALTLGGTSQLALDLTGYDPAFPTASFNVVHASSITGTFNTVLVNNNLSGYAVNVSYTTTDVVVTVGAVPVITPNAFPGGTAGSNFSYNIVASNNPSSYTATGLPPGLNFNNLSGQISGVPTTAGSYPVTMTATNKGGTSSPATLLTLTVNPGPFAKLQLLLPGETAAPGTVNGKTGSATAQNAGSPFSVTVNAVDNQWNVINTITDTVTFSANDSTAALPSNGMLSAGTANFQVTLTAASPPQVGQPTALMATDVNDNTKNATSANITVNRGAFAKLQLLLPGETAQPGSAIGKIGTPMQQQATASFNVTVNAVDAYWNVVNSSDTVTFTSTDAQAGLPQNTALTNGSKLFNVVFNLGPTQTLTAADFTDNTKTSNTSPSVSVRAGPYVKLLVLLPGETNAPGASNGKSGTPALQTGGTPFNVVVDAVDAFWTPVTTINDLVSITSSDTGAILPASASLSGGTKTFSVTLTTGPAQTVSASDVSDPNKLSNTSSSVAVATITSTLSAISPTAGVKNGAAFTLTVTGTNFLAGSVVQWNGASRPTTFVSATQLTAQIPATDLANAGLVNVTVFSPPPGTGSTSAGTFYVYSGTTVGTWIVRNTNDSGQDTLRLAMASCQKGDLITFDPTVFDLTNSNAATFINVLSALPNMDKGNVTIDASYQRVTINGSGAGSASGLEITSSNNVVMGLSIIGFSRSGVSIDSGAQNNTIGGSRTIGNNANGVPPGPNGQGLRISGNGTFGVQLSDPTTSGNVIKGCWIGLDISGTEANPNLAGILIQNGAHDNTIGGIGDGEQNVISGNAAEGITVSGTGSDNNTVVANVIGIAAVASTGTVATRDDSSGDIFSRSAVANGSSGIFLSRGTQNTSVGLSSTDDESMTAKTNVLGYNGGSGIEVRATTSKKNSSRGNRISHNGKSGISLYDGSNGGITAPNFTSVSIIGGRNSSSITRATASTVHVVGSATNGDGSAGSGTIEVFSDSSDQGATILGRSTVVSGTFDMEVSVADLSLNLTATYTDANGNTSPYAVYGALNSGATGAADPTTSALDTLLGIDPTNPSEVPTGTGTLTAGKFITGLNFAKTGHDSLMAQFAVQLPTGFSAAGATVAAVFDANTAKVTLDSKGKAPAGNTSVKIAASKTTSVGIVTVTIRNGSLLSGFATSGLTNETTAKTGAQATIPIGLALQTSDGSLYIYTGTVAVTYKATQGKSGKAMK